MSIIKIVSAVLALVILGWVGLAATKPDEFRVTRSAVIEAPAAVIFEHVNDLQKWQAWSPWVEMDPEATYAFEGKVSGLGATLHWDGEKSGKGTMIVAESRSPEFVGFQLEFLEPMQASNVAEIALAPEGTGTLVTWTMYGPNNFISKMMSVVMDCEKMVGDQFEKGLSNLKTIAEKK